MIPVHRWFSANRLSTNGKDFGRPKACHQSDNGRSSCIRFPHSGFAGWVNGNADMARRTFRGRPSRGETR